jgi:pyridoxamine 5'-phosphate oxidase family protein
MSNEPTAFTDSELAYLAGQRLGRLATVAPSGAPQNNPVGFWVNAELGTIDIFGFNLGKSKKYRNLKGNPNVAFVVDDLASVDPWVVRGVEIRGIAEALEGVAPPIAHMSDEVIRVHPKRIISWGVDPGSLSMSARDVTGDVAGNTNEAA